jgi:hypothetical protein
MTRARSALYVSMLVLLAVGCREMEFPPAGSYSDVDLIADGGTTGEWATMLVPVLTGDVDYFVAREPRFSVTSIESEPPAEPSTAKNVILCGVLDGSTAVGARIMFLLGEDGVARVRAGEASILLRENLPQSGQLTLIVTAPTEDALRRVIHERGEEIPDIVDANCRERLRQSLLRSRRSALSERMRRQWGFFIEIPTLYTLYSESDNPPGVELHRESPPRVLGVFWKEWDHAPTLYNTDELFDFRAAYVARRYEGDAMDRNRARYAYIRFGPYTAIRMSGYWHNDHYSVAGGYFETYFVWNKDEKLLWAVDGLVYAPGREKTSLVRELHALAETFRYE